MTGGNSMIRETANRIASLIDWLDIFCLLSKVF